MLRVVKFHFYSQEKKPHSPVVKCVSRGNLEIDPLILTLFCHRESSSCIFVRLPVRTHFTDYLCHREAIAKDGELDASVPVSKCCGSPG